MNMTLGLLTKAASVRLYRTRPRGARGRSAAVILALIEAGLTAFASGQVIKEFPIPTPWSFSLGIAAGPDGSLWFTEYGLYGSGNKIGRITTAGTITEFSLPAGGHPNAIAAGADGNLWFTEDTGNRIGRITTAGVITEFTIPTAICYPWAIAAGPDGSLWFTEADNSTNKIGRITTSGVITEFANPGGFDPTGIAAGPEGNLWFSEQNDKIGRITTAGAITEFVTSEGTCPYHIAAGPDGNLWFTGCDSINRITTAGVVTEFTVPTPGSGPNGIAAGPDGNLWFTEYYGHKIGRITTAGVITEFPIPTALSYPTGIAAGPDGNLWFIEAGIYANKIGRITTAPTTPQVMTVDAGIVAGGSSNANGVLEPGETVQVAPSWKNTLTDSQAFAGTASNLSGQPGPTYTLDDGSADYGTLGAGAIEDCESATGDCYLMTVSGTRPSAHWDATFTESLSSDSISTVRTLHVGESFHDVAISDPFYGFIENLFHNGVTGGCPGGNYCPTAPVTRAQMAVFLLKGKLGASQIPPPATGTVFHDVHIGDFATDWIEQLAGFQITGGCGTDNYCPNNPVTRAQMAVFLLKAEHGSVYTPPACAGIFEDVTCPSQFADWIERLSAEGITGGCGGGNYCPNSPSTRGQMAVFVVKTFGLELYGR